MRRGRARLQLKIIKTGVCDDIDPLEAGLILHRINQPWEGFMRTPRPGVHNANLVGSTGHVRWTSNADGHPRQ